MEYLIGKYRTRAEAREKQKSIKKKNIQQGLSHAMSQRGSGYVHIKVRRFKTKDRTKYEVWERA